MSDTFKIFGKKIKVTPQAEKVGNSQAIQWKFSLRPGGWIIAESDTGKRERFILQSQVGGRFSAHLRGQLWHGEWKKDRHEAAEGSRGSDSDLVAQFPGKVRKILVEAGKSVKEGDSLILMEAMKMEFVVKAPFAGKVTKVLVQEGQQISPGDRFIDLEMDLEVETLGK